MPKILPSDNESSYVSRCLAFVMKEEGLSKDAGLGKCYGIWKEHVKKKKQHKKSAEGEEILKAALKKLEDEKEL